MSLSASLLVRLGMGNRQSRPWIVSDELWSLIEPLLPKPGPKKAEGRPRVPDRQALCRILFVLHTGIQWEYLPHELGFGSGIPSADRGCPPAFYRPALTLRTPQMGMRAARGLRPGPEHGQGITWSFSRR